MKTAHLMVAATHSMVKLLVGSRTSCGPNNVNGPSNFNYYGASGGPYDDGGPSHQKNVYKNL